VGRHSDGSLTRLTLDCQLFSEKVSELTLGDPSRGIGIGCGQEILELKYLGEMPEVFKQLVQTFPVQRTAMSKYRTAAAALGLAAKHA
jgi:hypothetical protein